MTARDTEKDALLTPSSLARALPRHTGDSAAELAAVPREVADRLWRALGHPDVDEGDRRFTDDDVRALSLVTEGLTALDPEKRTVGLDLILQEVRLLSAMLGGVAEAEVEFLVKLRRLGLRRRLLDDVVQHGLYDSDLGWLIGYTMRSRLHTLDWHRPATATNTHEQLAIGFTDLVGFTALIAAVGDDDIVDVITEFQEVAFDTIAETGARAVKLVGDAVMFVAASPTAVFEAARAIHADRRWSRLPMRTGLAYGRAVRLGGDFYGPAVNLASRLAGAAVPDQILINEPLATRIEGPCKFHTRIIDVRGLGPIRALSVGDDEPRRSSTASMTRSGQKS